MLDREFSKIQHNFPDQLIMLAYRGSYAHGLYVSSTDPNSVDDVDLMGVFVGSYEHYLGLRPRKDHKEFFEGKYDVVCYELRKFVNLLIKCNPNVMGMLWLKSEHYLMTTRLANSLIRNRDLFASKLAYKSFTGYAHGQLRRMQKTEHMGYMGEKRKRLVEKYGYDTKNASHLIRLLRMGIEFLQTGILNVFRTHDSKELLDIKNGKHSLEYVKSLSEELFEDAAEAYKWSTLPAEPDVEAIEDLFMTLLESFYFEDKEGVGRASRKVSAPI